MNYFSFISTLKLELGLVSLIRVFRLYPAELEQNHGGMMNLRYERSSNQTNYGTILLSEFKAIANVGFFLTESLSFLE